MENPIEKLVATPTILASVRHYTFNKDGDDDLASSIYMLIFSSAFLGGEEVSAKKKVRNTLSGPFGFIEGLDDFATQVEETFLNLLHGMHQTVNRKTGKAVPVFNEPDPDRKKGIGRTIRDFGKARSAGLFDGLLDKDSALQFTVFSGAYYDGELSDFFDEETERIIAQPLEGRFGVIFHVDKPDGGFRVITKEVTEGIEKYRKMNRTQ